MDVKGKELNGSVVMSFFVVGVIIAQPFPIFSLSYHPNITPQLYFLLTDFPDCLPEVRITPRRFGDEKDAQNNKDQPGAKIEQTAQKLHDKKTD
jgi:hypothetical protein